MKYIQKRQRYEASNFSFQPDGQVGISYNWWIFSTEYDDKLIFNNTTYSPSTTKHQSKGYSHLSRKPDLVLRNTRESLADLPNAFADEINNNQIDINSLIRAIEKPRSHKRKNEERIQEINWLIRRSKMITEFGKSLGFNVRQPKRFDILPTTLIGKGLYPNIAVNTGEFLVLRNN